jgi:hypothetical protein
MNENKKCQYENEVHRQIKSDIVDDSIFICKNRRISGPTQSRVITVRLKGVHKT